MINTNLTGCFLMTQAISRSLIASETTGRIVNISSMLGVVASGQVHAYAASKAGINQLTRTSALELARHGISVNAIAPGYIETNLNRDFLNGPAGGKIVHRIAQRRFGQPADLEGVLLLLTTPAGSYMTGEIITVDGALTVINRTRDNPDNLVSFGKLGGLPKGMGLAAPGEAMRLRRAAGGVVSVAASAPSAVCQFAHFL